MKESTDLDKRSDSKRAYTSPQLVVYGSLASLTQNMDGTHNPDGGGGTGSNMNRTS